MICWYSYGDKLRLCDIDLGDGHFAEGYAWWELDNVWHDLGGEDDGDDQYCDWLDVDIPEGAIVHLWISNPFDNNPDYIEDAQTGDAVNRN